MQACLAIQSAYGVFEHPEIRVDTARNIYRLYWSILRLHTVNCPVNRITD
jgi:hypothetical protein